MKYHLNTTILFNQQIASSYFELTLEAPQIAAIAQPGQFLQIKPNSDLNPLLPRPLGLSAADAIAGTISCIYQVKGKGTELLAKLTPGDQLHLTGPLGNGFWIEPGVKRVGLIAGGTGIGPILFMADRLKKDPAITAVALIGARSREQLCLQERFFALCVAVLTTTDDGSIGHHGFVTDILADACARHQLDQLIAVGPMPMMRKATAIGQKLKIPVLVSLEERMACGIGICLGCVVKLSDGQHHPICTEGPVFRGNEVIWNEN